MARILVVAVLVACAAAAANADDALRRGEYLSRIMDCGGCHTPGALAGRPDPRLQLAGSDVGFAIPDLGYFYPPNLTPDPETGLGRWTPEEVIAAIRTGVRPDGRILVPIMPWHSYAALTDDDARSLVTYLRSLAPIRNAPPPMTASGATPPGPYLTVVVPR